MSAIMLHLPQHFWRESLQWIEIFSKRAFTFFFCFWIFMKDFSSSFSYFHKQPWWIGKFFLTWGTWTRWGGRGQKSMFLSNVHPQGIKIVHAGGGQKLAKFCPTSCWTPLILNKNWLFITPLGLKKAYAPSEMNSNHCKTIGGQNTNTNVWL